MRISKCRASGSEDLRSFLDLGITPLADALVKPEDIDGPEARFPLELVFCPESALVQITEDVPEDVLFDDNYLYFSSFSDVVLKHSREHAMSLIDERGLTEDNLVVELASNDGYLLRNFVEVGIPVLGIDPSSAPAKAANDIGVPTMVEFFGNDLATRLVRGGKRADVIVANNVFAHIPDINDFTAGMETLLADDGVIHIENPYVRDLIEHCEFDTIYHEHFYYHSCTSIDRQMRRHGLFLNHVEYFPKLHGGTLRWHCSRSDQRSETVQKYLDDEVAAGMDTFEYYEAFADRVKGVKRDLLALLTDLKAQGKTVAGYGAAAKGATLINYVGIGTDLMGFVVDRNVHKQGMHMPGTHQVVKDTFALVDEMPDYVLLLAWNFKDEIMAQQADYLARGGKFIVPVPTPQIVE
ncbi:MAG: class I SAM-dependent methyltransferase [Actinomycetia bacterium]|nr:class I SAM-dependent methyltransferase [Actinomycetes bacterium]MCP4960669.1 class I SAM-dependent methyltransferase [Actinomycetes bacterium]